MLFLRFTTEKHPLKFYPRTHCCESFLGECFCRTHRNNLQTSHDPEQESSTDRLEDKSSYKKRCCLFCWLQSTGIPKPAEQPLHITWLIPTQDKHDSFKPRAVTCGMFSSYQVWAFGRLSVFASIKWMVNSLGPAAPVEPYRQTF